ncbi:AAA family ATPase [Kitasatospora sp. NBC_00240]|uniref:BTAD domain-containing putative transcriptional regulator n=1 Tax=Kitasatospora sp. NBC_00240 TaxID=2903567 RepID=UPI002256FCEF|nr:BTAD domain-containing putative transcriptional regulator [Kitasatospora sp. NBC_00240]MCX5209562.1 AAA family ATPase [Kitasatospora sp. NBC_00240]
MVRITVLGSLAAEVGGDRVGLGGPRQRGVLAQLLAARGEVVHVDRIIEDLWQGRPPAKAAASVQAYVSNLRRLLEPRRGPREPARLLVSEPPGYALRLPAGSVDAWRFGQLLEEVRAEPRAGAALALLDEALALWRGAAYAEFADEPWAVGESARLTELRLAAREHRTALAVRLGRPDEAAVEARALTDEDPLREEGWRLLALALWHTGRQAEALDVLRRARAVLAEELGLDPGPALAGLESAILQQRTELLGTGPLGTGPPGAELLGAELLGVARPAQEQVQAQARAQEQALAPADRRPVPAVVDRAAAGHSVADRPVLGGTVLGGTVFGGGVVDGLPGRWVPGGRPVEPWRPTRPPAGPLFVGREAELLALRRAAAEAAGGGPAVAIVTGEAGAGKSTLLAHLHAELAAAGWRTASGRCPESEGAPPAWAWTEALRDLARQAPPDGDLAVALAPVLDQGLGPDPGPYGDRDRTPGTVQAFAVSAPTVTGSTSVAGAATGRDDVLRQPGGSVAFRPPGGLFAGRPGEPGPDHRGPDHRGPGHSGREAVRTLGTPTPTPMPEARTPHGRPLTTRTPDARTAENRTPWSRSDALVGRFRLHRAVGDWLHRAAADRPVAIVLDDLHAADRETRDLLTDLAGGPPTPGLLLVLAHRPGEGELTDALAVLARRSPHRIPLAGLREADAGRLIGSVCAAAVDPGTVHALADRTGGNPFYLLESARLLAREGALVAVHEVPQGVRDVLRRRFDRLPPTAVAALRLAAVVGREADAEVLLRASDADEDELLEALEAAVEGGLLTEPRPGTVRFNHALVRDTLYADLGGLRRARLHGRVAEALRELRPDRIQALAHHYTQAATSATAGLAVDYCVRAAEAAERRYAHETSAALLRQALDSFDRLPPDGGDREARRTALLADLLRAQVRMGAVAAATETKATALRLAREAGRHDLLIDAWTAWTEPTPWVTHPYGSFDQAAVDSITALLDHPGMPAATRCRLLDALTYELDCSGRPEGWEAAAEALAIARAEGDPRLLAMALAAQARVHDYELASDLRGATAAELARVATEHDLPAYRWHAEYLASSVAATAGDLPALRAHVEAAREIAESYGLAELLDVGNGQLAMLASAAGRTEEAQRLYALTVAGLRARGSVHAEGFAALATVVMALQEGRLAAQLPLIEHMRTVYGALAADIHALALVALGRPAEARAARAEPTVLPPDYYRSLFLTVRAMAVIALDERAEAAELIEDLLPLRDLVAGSASTSIALRPVAQSLGELTLLLGRPEEAAGHFRQAAAVARRWESAAWTAEAERALAELGPLH